MNAVVGASLLAKASVQALERVIRFAGTGG